MTDPTASSALKEIRDRLEFARSAAESAGQVFKDGMLPLERIRDAYSRLGREAQALGGQVFAEWLESDDENRRFDALALIDEFRLADVAPALRRLAERLRESRAPSAPFERGKVDRVLAEFAQIDAQAAQEIPGPDFARHVTIGTPADLRGVLSMIRAATSVGDLTQAVGEDYTFPELDVSGLPADGPWPDVIDAEFLDRAGRRYRLFVETFHGAGGEWTPLDADD